MSDLRILISGDYWHHEFQSIVADFPVPVTLAPIDRIESLLNDSFDLIVLAQTRPDQIPLELVERIQTGRPTTPVVALLGSWCEGGMRTDVPWPGVRRIYWHQWCGRFDQFSKQLSTQGITLWHQPRTATAADDLMVASKEGCEGQVSLVAVSAADQTQFEYLRDAIESFGWQACWAERAALDPSTIGTISAVCVDGNSVSDELINRVEWLLSELGEQPTVLALNFPRVQDVEAAAVFGIKDVVSKPFEACDLKHAIDSAIDRKRSAEASAATVPAPHRVGSTSKSS